MGLDAKRDNWVEFETTERKKKKNYRDERPRPLQRHCSRQYGTNTFGRAVMRQYSGRFDSARDQGAALTRTCRVSRCLLSALELEQSERPFAARNVEFFFPLQSSIVSSRKLSNVDLARCMIDRVGKRA